jgi:hypothetical protein
MSFLSRKPVRRAIYIAVVLMAVVVVTLTILVASGVLVLRSSGSGSVTVRSVYLNVDQGRTSGGSLWFVPGDVNYTSANGYPVQVSPGGSWTIVWTFFSMDTVSHTIYRVVVTSSPNASFTFHSSTPSIPLTVPGGDEDAKLAITITAPSTPGISYAVTVNVIANSPS